MARIVLGVTGSVAAIRTPELYHRLSQFAEVKLVATEAATYFFDFSDVVPAINGQRDRAKIILDSDEWPGREQGRGYRRGEPVLHIELRRWADALVIAPLDANTLAKIALGLCDNCLTCLWRAWDPARPRVLAPAMNTLMWENPATDRHLKQLALDAGVPNATGVGGQPEDWVGRINAADVPLRVVPPQVKRLACDDVGIGAMAEVDAIIEVVRDLLPR